MRRRFYSGAASVICVCFLAGCSNKTSVETTPAQVHPPSEPQRLVLGKSFQGTPIEAEIHGTGSETVLIIATIHGNEAAGTPLLGELSRHLVENPELLGGRRVILIPIVNPDGMAARKRFNARGIDLNRNFPADNWSSSTRHGPAALSEPESRILYDLLHRERPARIVTIHQPLTCVDYDGPGEPLARAMASACDLPFKHLGSRPGSLGSYAGLTLKIPIVTVEFSRAADALAPPELWTRYGKMLLAAIEYAGP